MSSENLKKITALNTLSNYILYFSGIVSTIIATPLLIKALGEDGYGFWAWAWAIFGYSILLDFGFGYSVQKYTAEFSVTKDIVFFNKLINTVIGCFLIMSVILALLTLLTHNYLGAILSLENNDSIEFYKKIYLIFGFMVALTFPTGVFGEVLQGLKKTYIKNIVRFGYHLLNILGIYCIYIYNLTILELTIFTISLGLVNNFILCAICYWQVPGIKFSPKYFEFMFLKRIASFSFYSFVTIFTGMIIMKTDAIVLGAMIGPSAVAVYQIGVKVPMMANGIGTQFQSNLAPIAASLYKSNDISRLRRTLLKANKLVVFLGILFFANVALYSDLVLKVWLYGSNIHISSDVINICYIMIVAMFVRITFGSVATCILFMVGNQKYITKLAVTEAIANLILSIVFVRLLGCVGVAIGTLIPTMIITLFFILPEMCRYCKINTVQYLIKTPLKMVLLSLPSIVILLHLFYLFPSSQWMEIIKHEQQLLGSLMLAINGRLYLIFVIVLYSSLAWSLYLLIGFNFILDRENKVLIKEYLKRQIGRIKATGYNAIDWLKFT